MLPFHLHTEKIAGKNRKIAAVLFRRFSRSAACRRGIAHLMFEFLDELLTMSCERYCATLVPAPFGLAQQRF
jgi:hypothetical protein